MATKTLYPLDAMASGVNWGDMQEDSAPATATMVTGWVVGTTTPPGYSRLRVTNESVNGNFQAASLIDAAAGPTDFGTLADAWRSPTAYTGSFADTAWDFQFAILRIDGTSTPDGRLRFRVWKSADGTDATSPAELTSGTLVTTIATNVSATPQNITASWSPGAITLTNEYLFFQGEWEITGAGSGAAYDVHVQQDSATRIITPNFTTGSVVGTSTALRQGRRRRR